MRGVRWNQPDLGVEAVQMRECVVQGVEFRFDVQFIFFPSDETDIDCVVPGTSSIWKGLICGLECERGVRFEAEKRQWK